MEVVGCELVGTSCTEALVFEFVAVCGEIVLFFRNGEKLRRFSLCVFNLITILLFISIYYIYFIHLSFIY